MAEKLEKGFDVRKIKLQQAALSGTIIEWDLQLDFIHQTKWAIKSDLEKNATASLSTDKASELNHFEPGMRVEAIDRVYPQYVCVASILRVLGNEVLVFFDGWSNSYNYWCRFDSPEIRPVGTAERLKMPLCPPSSTSPSNSTDPSWRKGGCSWKGYLEQMDCKAAPDHIFGNLVIPEGSVKFSELAEKKDACDGKIMELGNNTLFEICARKILVEKIDYTKCPIKIRQKLDKARRCILCEGPFLVGYHAILPWTSVEWIRNKPFTRMTIVCSKECAENFIEYRFPFDKITSKSQEEQSNRRYYTLHRTFYSTDHKDLKISVNYAESRGFNL